MLCPQCRRQVGGDGYCPEGHLAAPERTAPREPVFAPSEMNSPGAVGSSEPGAPPLPAASGRTRRPIVIAAALVLLAAVLRFFAFGPSASAANLKYVFSKGEVHRYAMTMSFDMSAGSLAFGGGTFRGSLEMLLSQTATAVDGDGVATIRFGIEKLVVNEGRRSVDVPIPPNPLTIKMAPDGRVLDAEGNGLISLGGSDPVSDISGMFGPESFGPILPDRRIDPGQSWSIDEDMANPFGDTIRFRGTAKLLGREIVGGEEEASIRTVTNTPFNFRISFADLADLVGTDVPGELRKAKMTFDGYFSSNFTQKLATKGGFLRSALGDFKMTGTLGFEDVPQVAQGLTAVFNMSFHVTMTAIS